MSRHRLFVTVVLAAAGVLGIGTDARAEWIVTPYGGMNWGAAATFNDAALSYDDEFVSRANVGAAAGWRSGPLVFEFDFGYLPEFFADRKADDDFEFGSSHVLTMMADVRYVPGFRFLGLQPYAAGGFGVIRTHIEDEFELFTVDSTNAAFDAGGGVLRALGRRYAIRGDVRYFRTVQEKLPAREVDVAIGALEFWRATGGLTIRF